MHPPDDEPPRSFASPPCFMHELDPAYFGLPPKEDARETDAAPCSQSDPSVASE